MRIISLFIALAFSASISLSGCASSSQGISAAQKDSAKQSSNQAHKDLERY